MFKKTITIAYKKELITLKLLNEASHKQTMDYLKSKLHSLKSLYTDEKTPILIKGKILKNKEMDEIQSLITSYIDVEVMFDIPKDMGLHRIERTFEKNIDISETKFQRGSIRSGNRVESAGSLVIIGDVNSGAEVIAAENIVILGALRGLAHAGAQGNKDAIISASRIDTSQIRISNIVKKMNRADTRVYLKATAYIDNEQIVID